MSFFENMFSFVITFDGHCQGLDPASPHSTRRIRLSHNPQLLIITPPPVVLNARDNLHPSLMTILKTYLWTVVTNLRRRHSPGGYEFYGFGLFQAVVM
ncbi:MAG: hypothetical protein KGH75_01845 [Rhodospirillales bacterium]|nr:hypothetical protein [Rhodospirillales bacterium]